MRSTAASEDCHVLRHVSVAETNARARDEAEPHLDYFWQKMQELGAGTFMGLFQFGSMPYELVKTSVKLFAETVLPELKRG